MENHFSPSDDLICRPVDTGRASTALPKRSDYFPLSNYIPSISYDTIKNGCKILGPRDAKIAVIHYHGCMGLSENEWTFINYILRIKNSGWPALSVIIPQSHKIISSTPIGRHVQVNRLTQVVAGFSEEQKKYLPTSWMDFSVAGITSKVYHVYLQGSQQWHEIILKKPDGSGLIKPDLEATTPLLLKAGHEVTRRTADVRHSLGINKYVSSGFSLGVGMAAYDTYLRDTKDDAPMGVLLAGAPLIWDVCRSKPVVNPETMGLITIGKNDPIPEHALGHNINDVRAICNTYGLSNLQVHCETEEPYSGHYLNPTLMARSLAGILNAKLKFRPMASI